jgi:hypothetical protein
LLNPRPKPIFCGVGLGNALNRYPINKDFHAQDFCNFGARLNGSHLNDFMNSWATPAWSIR